LALVIACRAWAVGPFPTGCTRGPNAYFDLSVARTDTLDAALVNFGDAGARLGMHRD